MKLQFFLFVLVLPTVTTEASVIPRAVFYFGLAINVEKLALLVATLVVLRVEEALGHLAHVVLMQELALVALLAQAAQPVLANHRLFALDVTKRT